MRPFIVLSVAFLLSHLTPVYLHALSDDPPIPRRAETTELPDFDEDGIPDHLEAAFPGPGQTNMYLPDSDGDGVWDGVEDANQNGQHDPGETFARNRDSDGDGFEDGIEIYLLGSDPLDPLSPGVPYVDTDGDGLPDFLDPDPLNPDTDGDGYLDGYEAVTLGLPAVTDPNIMPTLGNVYFYHPGRIEKVDGSKIYEFFTDSVCPAFPGDIRRADIDRNGIIDNVDAFLIMWNWWAFRYDFLLPLSRSSDIPGPSDTGVEISVVTLSTNLYDPIEIVTDVNDVSIGGADFIVAVCVDDISAAAGYAFRIGYNSDLVRYRPGIYQNGLPGGFGRSPGSAYVRETQFNDGPASSIDVTGFFRGYVGRWYVIYLGFDVIGPPGSHVVISIEDDPRSTGPFHDSEGNNILHTSPGTPAEVWIDFIPTPTPIGPDYDGDGIPDALEARVPGPGQTNMYLPDSDGDGLWDGVEDANRNAVHNEPGETDPRSRDSDGDQFEDGIEVLIVESDPLDSGSPGVPFVDVDGDGLPDSHDPDPSNPDADGDRILDSYEAVVLSLAAVTDATITPNLGDVDGNEVRDNADAQRILNFFAGNPDPDTNPAYADLDRNGFIDNADAQYSLNFFGTLLAVLPR